MINPEEQQYLNLLHQILNTGEVRKDRTGTGVKSIFGATMRFSLRDQLILLTTKKVFFRAIFEELKFFLSGKTDSKILEEKGVNIWKGNTRREYLDNLGLTYLPEGEMGCAYPHQWRNFGGEHPLIPETRGLKGVDQISKIINTIKTNPTDRRMYLIGSNPAQEHLMCLPPCHNYCQFYCNLEKKELSCCVLLRSNDLFLGCPFNFVQYNLLTIFLSAITGYQPGELFYTVIDAHLYLDHLDQVKEQLYRVPRSFPRLEIHKSLTSLDDVLNLDFKDLELIGYNPYPSIKGKMSA